MKVVLKTTIKQEVAHFVQRQLVPLVQTQLREYIVPACAQTVKSMAIDFVKQRWLSFGLWGTVVVTMGAVTVAGPWVAVFFLFRQQRR